MQCDWDELKDGEDDARGANGKYNDDSPVQKILMTPYRLAQSLNFALVDLDLLPPPPAEPSRAVDADPKTLEQKPLETMEDIWKSIKSEGQKIKGNSTGKL